MCIDCLTGRDSGETNGFLNSAALSIRRPEHPVMFSINEEKNIKKKKVKWRQDRQDGTLYAQTRARICTELVDTNMDCGRWHEGSFLDLKFLVSFLKHRKHTGFLFSAVGAKLPSV